MLAIGGCVVAITVIVVVMTRIQLQKKSEQLFAKIGCIPSYENVITNDGRKEAVYARNERFQSILLQI